MIVIESKNGIKFGAFFSGNIDFSKNKVKSYKVNEVILFNTNKKQTFQNKLIETVHTSTKNKISGLNAKIYFGHNIPNLDNQHMKFDLMIDGSNVLAQPVVVSSINQPGFNIKASSEGNNQLTG